MKPENMNILDNCISDMVLSKRIQGYKLKKMITRLAKISISEPIDNDNKMKASGK